MKLPSTAMEIECKPTNLKAPSVHRVRPDVFLGFSSVSPSFSQIVLTFPYSTAAIVDRFAHQ